MCDNIETSDSDNSPQFHGLNAWESSLSDGKFQEIQSRIQDFNSWFNDTARLHLLRCDVKQKEIFAYLLKALKQDIDDTVIRHCGDSLKFTCSNCSESVALKRRLHFWDNLQYHPHFEQGLIGCLSQQSVPECDASESSSAESYVDDSSDTTSSSSEVEIDRCQEKDFNALLVDLEAQDANAMATEPDLIQTPPKSPGLNDFRFNFPVTYDDRVEQTLYPSSMIKVARKRDGIPEYTVQRSGANRGVCLLCSCLLQSQRTKSKMNVYVVKTHVWGKNHAKSALSEDCKSALRNYHDFFRAQETNIQAHQVYFVPSHTKTTLTGCTLCRVEMPYEHVVKHIKHDEGHELVIRTIYETPGGKLNEFYLIELQLKVYGSNVEDIVPIDDGIGVVKKEKKVENGTNGTEPKNKPLVPKPECVIVKSMLDPLDIPLPNRYKLHKPFFIPNPATSDSLHCTVCKLNVFKAPSNLIEHILTDLHKTTAAIPSVKYNFYCDICNVYYNSEPKWKEHFGRPVAKRHDAMAPSRKAKVTEYECETCRLVMFGDELSVSRHKTAKSGKKKAELKLPATVVKLFKSRAAIEEEGMKMHAEAWKVLDCTDKTNDCCQDIEAALVPVFPGCKAYPFGSRLSGLGNEQSDLDIFVDLGNMYLGDQGQDSQTQENFVKKTAKLLRNSKDNFSNIVQIASARTPIVKVRHCFTNFDCDISFRHGLGVENTKFLRFCFDLQPITQRLTIVLKKWSNYCKLNEHISNYALALMAIFFLQVKGLLIPVNVVRRHNAATSRIIDGWETITYTVPLERMRELIKPYTGTLVQLLRDFFMYYSKFDYDNYIMCPLLGYLVKKFDFNDKPNGEGLPPEMRSYVVKIQSENAEIFRALSPLCIQDPFDLSHNLTKACQAGTVKKLKTYCALTCQHLDTLK